MNDHSLSAENDDRVSVCLILSAMLDRARMDGVSRHQVAAAMSDHVGRTVSKYMLDSYTAISRKDFNLPLYLVPGVQQACGDVALSRWLAERSSGTLLFGKDKDAFEIGRFVAGLDRIDESLQALEAIRQARKLLVT